MGDAVEARMNVAALRRVDPYAKDIVDSSAHVALYAFGDHEWAKTGVEGALFVYRRSGPPTHSLIVMNRLNTDNLIEPITSGLELQLQEPFLLYRNAHRRIYGLWFYDRDECARIASKIENLVREDHGPDHDPNNVNRQRPAPVKSDASVDIFTMLSKAQNDYNSKSKPARPVNDAPAPPRTTRAPDISSQSVMDFFAKAGGTAQQTPNLFGVACPPIADEGPMLLQRLKSNPAHSVEHIEKQQRSVTPKGDQKKPESKKKNKTDPSKTPNQKATINQQKPNGQTLDNDLSLMSLSTPKRSSSPVTAFLNQQCQKPTSARTDDNSSDARPPSATETPQKPALMPPTMFTSSAAKTASERQPVESTIAPARPVVQADVRPEPLTRNQLLQAFNYLVKNDAEFVTKLHEAYVKSFSELVS